MSGIRFRTGVVFAVVVFTLGVTAAVASGLENKGGTHDKATQENGKGKHEGGKDDSDKSRSDNGDKDRDKSKGSEDRDKEKSKGDEEKDTDKETPTVTTPSAPPAPGQVQTTPSAPTPLTPLSPQGTPSSPGEEVAQTPTAETPTADEEELAPAAERKKLAETGLDPAMIALLGAFLVGGGAFLFRRAFAR